MNLITPLFHTVHALVITNRPMSDSTWQCELDEAKCISLGDTYRNRISTANFMAFTALKAYNDISENLSECIFHSIIWVMIKQTFHLQNRVCAGLCGAAVGAKFRLTTLPTLH